MLPDGFYFLQTGWWVFHLLAIGFVVLVGYLIGWARRAWPSRKGTGDLARLPPDYRFLRREWWLFHLIAVPFVFLLGHILWR